MSIKENGMKDNFELVVEQKQGSIVSNLDALTSELNENLNHYRNLVVTEDTTKDAKKIISNLNKLDKEINDTRIRNKKEFMKPFEDFELQAKEMSSLIKEASGSISIQVKTFEGKVIEDKTNKVKQFFEEHKLANGYDFVNFEQVGLKIGLSNTITALEKLVIEFMDKVAADLALIETQQNKERILVKYYQSLDATQAITIVNNEILREEQLRARQEELKQQQEERIEPVKEVVKAPKIVEEIMVMKFNVEGTINQLKSVKNFLEREGIKYYE